MRTINVSDIIELNGKTIKENNMSKTHKFPVGSLVEIKFDEWYGKGGCIKAQARLFVVGHERDCDGTPLYKLCKRPDPEVSFQCLSELSNGQITTKQLEFLAGCFGMFRSGVSEDSLKEIEITSAIERGESSLEWKEGE